MSDTSRWVRRRSKLLLVGVAALLLPLAACDSSEGSGESIETEPSVEDESEAATADPATSSEPGAGEASADSVIRMRVQSDLDSWDPHLAASTGSMFWLGPVYETLIRATPEGEYEPHLAESFEFSPDGATLTLALRQGVTFSDGEALDAEAVVANFERAKTLEGSQRAPRLEAVESVTAVDEYTVDLALAETGAPILDLLSQMEGVVASPAAFDDPDFGQFPVGTGPFVLQEHRPDEVLIFESNPNYWGDGPQVSGVELQIIPDDSTTMSALESGEIDIFTEAQSLFPDTLIQRAQDLNGITVSEPGGVNLFEVTLNRAEEFPFSDERVRQAIYHAIDFDSVGSLVPRGIKALQYAVEGSPFYADGVEDMYPYDPERAQELLAEAGYEEGFSFDLRTVDSGPLVPISQLLQANLEQVGIGLNIVLSPLPAFRQDCFIDFTCTAVTTRVTMSSDPVRVAQSRMLEDGSASWGPIPSEVADAYATAEQLADFDTRVERVQEFSRNYIDHAVNLPLIQNPVAVLARDAIGNVEVDFTGMIDWATITKS